MFSRWISWTTTENMEHANVGQLYLKAWIFLWTFTIKASFVIFYYMWMNLHQVGSKHRPCHCRIILAENRDIYINSYNWINKALINFTTVFYHMWLLYFYIQLYINDYEHCHTVSCMKHFIFCLELKVVDKSLGAGYKMFILNYEICTCIMIYLPL
jgi:hypothetical protein